MNTNKSSLPKDITAVIPISDIVANIVEEKYRNEFGLVKHLMEIEQLNEADPGTERNWKTNTVWEEALECFIKNGSGELKNGCLKKVVQELVKITENP